MKNLGQRNNDLDIVVKKDLPTLSNTGGTELLTVNGTSVSIVTRDTAQTISSIKTFSSSPVLNNTKTLKGKNTGGTSYDLIGMSSNNTVDVGNTSQTMVLNCGGGNGGTGYVRPNNDNSKSLGTAGYRWKDIYISGEFADGNNANYGVKLPNTTNFTESKTLATTDQIPTVNNPTITFTQGGTTKGTITLNQSSDQTIALDAGGGGSVSIDNTSITENSSNQIQTVGVIDQKTGNANKQWTGTKAEYDALNSHDANTFYNITDDVGNEGNLVAEVTVTSGTTSVKIDGLDLVADGGVYDIVITWQPVNTTADYAYLKLNTSTSGYAWIEKYYPSYAGEYNYNASNFRIGHSGSYEAFSVLTLVKSNVSGSGVFFESINGSFGSAQYSMNFVGTNATISNVTSMTFTMAQSFKTGTRIKIYKRSTNNARVTTYS